MDEVTWLDYHPGGVPACQVFKMTLDELKKVLRTSPDKSGINRLNEICFIGLMSYYEAFCKDLFASILNILPALLENLRESGQDVHVDSSRVLLFRDTISYRMGSLVAEKYDFGTGQKINTLYKAILNITPLSKDEVKKYAECLRDRNLFVHHGGAYTLTYLQQANLPSGGVKENAYWNSLVLDTNYVKERIQFIEDLAKKMSHACRTGLNKLVSVGTIVVNDQQQKAIDSFLWWD